MTHAARPLIVTAIARPGHFCPEHLGAHSRGLVNGRKGRGSRHGHSGAVERTLWGRRGYRPGLRRRRRRPHFSSRHQHTHARADGDNGAHTLTLTITYSFPNCEAVPDTNRCTNSFAHSFPYYQSVAYGDAHANRDSDTEAHCNGHTLAHAHTRPYANR